MHIVIMALSLSKYLCSKNNIYSMKTVMCTQELTLPGRTNMFQDLQCHLLFDSLGTLNLVTTGHEAQNLCTFPAFLDNPVHRNVYFLKQFRIKQQKFSKSYHCKLKLQSLNFLIMVFASFYIHAQ